MSNYFYNPNNGELYHYGVLGQKWGVRRFQNEDGTLTAAGKQRYGVSSVGRNIGRAVLNTPVGQRIAVNLNKGYRADKKDIKAQAKQKREEIDSEKLDKNERKARLKELKSDTKKTLGEARVATAQANYAWQSKSLNEKIQTSNVGKEYIKSMLLGGYGALHYDAAKANGQGTGKAIVGGMLASMGSYFTSGLLGVGTYAYGTSKDASRKKQVTEESDIPMKNGQIDWKKVNKMGPEARKAVQTETTRRYYDNLKSNKSSLMKTAKEQGRYDMEFMEMLPDTISERGSSATLREYDRYLSDPEKWMQDRYKH